MNIPVLRARLMLLLDRNRGRANAVPREQVLFDLQAFEPTLDDRKFRHVYAGDKDKKNDHGAGVCSCADGLFIPVTPEEVEEFYWYIFKQSGSIVAARRRDNIYHWRPELRPDYGKQHELGI